MNTLNEKEIIQVIEETSYPNSSWSNMVGYRVLTNKQDIKLLISDGQSCCESWGYIISEDDPKDFVGAELLSVEKVDQALNTTKVKLDRDEYGYDAGGVIFINLNTDRGTFQLTVYNAHNGYYGHSVKFVSKDLILDTSL